MSLRLPKLGNLGNTWDRIWDNILGTKSRDFHDRKPRSLKIDPLEERQLLSISADATTLTIETGTGVTVGGQSIATDDNGDTVVVWTATESNINSITNNYETNVYAQYLTQDVQKLSLVTGTDSFYLVYGGSTITQKLSFSSTVTVNGNDPRDIDASLHLSFGAATGEIAYSETDYEIFASDLRDTLTATLGLTNVKVTCEDSRTFTITYDATDSSLLTHTVLEIDQDSTTFTDGFLPSVAITTESQPTLVGKIKVSATNSADTITSIESSFAAAGIDVTATAVADIASTAVKENLTNFYIQFNGNAGLQILDQLKVYNALNASGTDVTDSCSTRIVKESSGKFRVNPTEIDNPYTSGTDYTNQYDAAVSMDDDGDFIITWTNQNTDGTTDIYARRFSSVTYLGSSNLEKLTLYADITSTATSIVVNSVANGLTVGTTIKIDSEQMIITSISYADVNKDGTYESVCGVTRGVGGTAAAVHLKGTKVSPLMLIDNNADGVQETTIQCVRSDIAPVVDGLTIIDSASGTFRVNTLTANNQGEVSISMNAEGNFAISWSSAGQDSSFFNSVWVRNFTADGKPVDVEYVVSQNNANRHSGSAVALSDANLVGVVWLSAPAGAVSYDNDGITVLFTGLDSSLTKWDGTLVKSMTQIATLSAYTSCAFDTADDFVVSWSADGDNDTINIDANSWDDIGVYAIEYNSVGTVIQPVWRVSSGSLTPTSVCSWPAGQANGQVTIDADGDITIVYEGFGSDITYDPTDDSNFDVDLAINSALTDQANELTPQTTLSDDVSGATTLTSNLNGQTTLTDDAAVSNLNQATVETSLTTDTGSTTLSENTVQTALTSDVLNATTLTSNTTETTLTSNTVETTLSSDIAQTALTSDVLNSTTLTGNTTETTLTSDTVETKLTSDVAQTTLTSKVLGTVDLLANINEATKLSYAVAVSSLTAAIDAVQTTITVKSNTSFAVGDTIQIDSECMIVTAVNSDGVTLSVTRGASNGTDEIPPAAAHELYSTVGAAVITVESTSGLTAGTIIQVGNEQMLITKKVGTVLYVTRGYHETDAVAHAAGTSVATATIRVDDTTTTFSSKFGIVVGDEYMTVTGIKLIDVDSDGVVDYALWTVIRGVGGTTISSHMADEEDVIANTIKVFDATGLAVGDKIYVDTELMTIVGIDGKTLTVSRSASAVAHAKNISVTSATITVDGVLTASTPFGILVESEQMTVTSIKLVDLDGDGTSDHTVCTVTRGEHGTTVASHTSGNDVIGNTINVASAIGYEAGDTVQVGNEHMKIISKTGNQLRVERAADGTTMAAHLKTATVSSATIKVADTTTTFTKPFGIQVGNESMTVTGIQLVDNNSDGVIEYALWTVTRGVNSSTIATHLINEKVVTNTLVVADITGLAVGNTILIGTEYMRITAISGNTLTVVRGANGSTVATHNTGDAVYSATITVTDAVTTDTAVPFGIVIGNEFMTVIGVSSDGKTLTVLRSEGGTTIASHLSGSTVNSNTIDVADASELQVGDIIQVGTAEHMKIEGKVGNQLTVTRAVDGTTLSAHVKGDMVASAELDVADTTTTFTKPFGIQVGNEFMTVIGIVNNGTYCTWTVIRGIGGTTIASHLATDAVIPNTIKVADATGFKVGDMIQIGNELMIITAIDGQTITVSRAANGTAAVTHLKGDMVASATIKVEDFDTFPTTNGYSIQIGNEIMTVVGGAGTDTWTVLRGQFGTTIASHSASDAVHAATIYVASAENIQIGDIIQIGTRTTGIELMRVLAVDAVNGILIVQRGVYTTTVITHVAGLAVTDDTLHVADASLFDVGDVVQIGNELMTILTIDTVNNILVVLRGTYDTTIAHHNNLSQVICATIKVADYASFPTENGFGIQIGNEFMRVIFGAGTNTWIVLRGILESSVVTHHTGDLVLQNTFTVDSSTDLVTGTKIQIGDEVMTIILINGDTITVRRNIYGLTNLADLLHANGSTVIGVIEVASMLGDSVYEFPHQNGDMFVIKIDNEKVLVTVTQAETTLVSAISDTDTTIVVADATGFPTEPGFVIQIDNEYMRVIAIAADGVTWTVIRGINNSTPAAHAVDAAVTTFFWTYQRGYDGTVITKHDEGSKVIMDISEVLDIDIPEVQVVSFSLPGSGWAAISMGGVKSADFEFDSSDPTATAAALLAAIQDIATLGDGEGDITVTEVAGSNGMLYTVTFSGAYAGVDQDPILQATPSTTTSLYAGLITSVTVVDGHNSDNTDALINLINETLGQDRETLEEGYAGLRGDAYGILATQMDANSSYGSVAVLTSDVQLNELTDGSNQTINILIESDINAGTFSLRVYDPYIPTTYQDILITPVFDDNGNLLIGETSDAIEAALNSATAMIGTPVSISVDVIGADAILAREGTYWAVLDSSGNTLDSEKYVVFQVTFWTDVHDTGVPIALTPNGNKLTKSVTEEQVVTFSKEGSGWVAISMGDSTSEDFWYDSSNPEGTAAALRAAIQSIAEEGDGEGDITVVAVEGTAGTQYYVTFTGAYAGVDQALITQATTEQAGLDNPQNVFVGALTSVTMVNGGDIDAADPQLITIVAADSGTAQYESSVAMQADGTFVVVYTQGNESTNQVTSNYLDAYANAIRNPTTTSILVQSYTESTDTAGPTVTALETITGDEVLRNGNIIVASSSDKITYLVIDFSEAMYCVENVDAQLTALGFTRATASADLLAECETKWAMSVLNPLNYVIALSGTTLNDAVVGVSYGLNQAFNLGCTAIGNNKYQAILTIDTDSLNAGNQGLSLGKYTITFKHYVASSGTTAGQSGLCDVIGNSLGTTGFNSKGIDLTYNFTIGTSSGADMPTDPDESETDDVQNTTETGKQDSAVVASASDGSYVLVWVRYGSGTDSAAQGEIVAQRYSTTGKAVGAEFVVNTYTAGSQISPSVAMNDNGSFVVVWSGVGTGNVMGIWARTFSAKGVATSSQVQVSLTSTANQVTPSVAMANDGSFVVTWVKGSSTQTHIYARRYSSSAVALAKEFKVNTTNAANTNVDVSMAADTGYFVIVWQSCSTTGTDLDIHARMYKNSTGAVLSPEFTVNTYLKNSQSDPAVAMDDDDSFVVTWTSYAQDGSANGVYARRYTYTTKGSTVTISPANTAAEFLVNKVTANNQWQSDVACDSDGNFVIGWSSYGQDNPLADDYGIYARMYNYNCTDFRINNVVVGVFRVNATVTGNQVSPSLAWNYDGGNSNSSNVYIAAWVGPDTDSTGIFSRRLDPPTKATTTAAVTSGTLISTIGLYNAATATAYLNSVNSAGIADLIFTYGAKANKWTVISGDWNGDGVSTLGLYDPSTSTFYLADYNKSGSTVSRVFKFGTAKCGYAPIVGDWDGDGIDTIGLYNTKTATFYLRNSNTTGGANLTFKFGSANAGYMAVIGDWDGNGTDTVGVYNGKTSTFYLRNANSAGGANMTFKFGTAKAGSIALAGDWDGDGKDSIGLYTAKTGAFVLRNANSAGSANYSFQFGPKNSTWKPIVGDWNGYAAALTATEVKTASSSTKSVTTAQVQTLVSEAISRWVAAGISSAQAALLSNVKFAVTDLAGANLGLADGNVIYIDANAAGNGWYVDSTPGSDSEFTSGSKVKGIDLLTVLEHEMGHILGLSDIDSLANDVMSRTLTAGTRRNASNEDVIDLILASR